MEKGHVTHPLQSFAGRMFLTVQVWNDLRTRRFMFSDVCSDEFKADLLYDLPIDSNGTGVLKSTKNVPVECRGVLQSGRSVTLNLQMTLRFVLRVNGNSHHLAGSQVRYVFILLQLYNDFISLSGVTQKRMSSHFKYGSSQW